MKKSSGSRPTTKSREASGSRPTTKSREASGSRPTTTKSQEDELFSRLARLLPGESTDVLRRYRECFEPSDLVLNAVLPGATQAFSVTGSVCELKCAHCSGHYLRGMKPFSDLTPTDFSGKTSILLSGGSDAGGRVPLARVADRIKALPGNLRLNLHVGFQDAAELGFLAGRKVTVSFDLIGDNATLAEVFGLPLTVERVQDAYLDLARTFPTVPHITLGLRGGRFSGEYETLKFLQAHQPALVTLLVFRPTPKTPYAGCFPPSFRETGDFFKAARTQLTGEINLGCMRPAGDYRLVTDTLAWWLGIRTIVHPHRALRQCLETCGVPVHERHECCSLEPSHA